MGDILASSCSPTTSSTLPPSIPAAFSTGQPATKSSPQIFARDQPITSLYVLIGHLDGGGRVSRSFILRSASQEEALHRIWYALKNE
ncbi:unnamed protein product [Spirodela intermedia]|uniref:Uncharacterized protein n=1 Tax=Spirodela intermedia TaxID=51605 RepID=A0ABN7EEH0_SPIIN|nr:unnamed protein product [Spirodela intermedia]